MYPRCVSYFIPTYILPTYCPVMPYTSSTFLCDQQEPVHPPKCSNCSREMIAGAFSHPGADTSSLVRTSYNAGLGLAVAAKKWGHFPRSTKGRTCPCSQDGGGGHWALHAEWLEAGSMGPSHREALKVQESTGGQCTESKIYCTLQEPVSVLGPKRRTKLY